MTTNKKRLDTIIHIGAGRGNELQSHLSEGPRRVILIDADNAAVSRLQRLGNAASTAGTAVEVIQAAIAGEEKDVELRIYNLERVSGIREPEALLEVYPGLKLVRSSIHRSFEAAKFIESLSVDHDKDNKLIIDAPGEELAILESLSRKDLLSAFPLICVSMARRPLYKGGSGMKDMLAALERAGFITEIDARGDWVNLKSVYARAQSDIVEIERLTKELARVDAARASHEQNVVELSKKNANLTAEIEKLKSTIAKLEGMPVDVVDRKSIFAHELGRCEMQIDLLKELLLNGRES